eukprot:jgi/Tetstr1/447387/TSEL_034823.t1
MDMCAPSALVFTAAAAPPASALELPSLQTVGLVPLPHALIINHFFGLCCGGTLSLLDGMLTAGFGVTRVTLCEISPVRRRWAADRLRMLSAEYPTQLHEDAFQEAFSSTPQDVTLITEEVLAGMPPVTLVAAGPCSEPWSSAGSGRGWEDMRSGVMAAVIRISEAAGAVDRFLAFARRKGFTVRHIRVDRAAVFLCSSLEKICKDANVDMQTCDSYSPHQNARAERPWRTLACIAKCQLLYAGLPLSFWELSWYHAVYIINRKWSAGPADVPLLAAGQEVDLSGLRVFGCPAYVHLDRTLRRKADVAAWKGIYVGQSRNSPGWQVYNPTTGAISVTRSAVFCESWRQGHTFPFDSQSFSSEPLLESPSEAATLYPQSPALSVDDDDDPPAYISTGIIHPSVDSPLSPASSPPRSVDNDDHTPAPQPVLTQLLSSLASPSSTLLSAETPTSPLQRGSSLPPTTPSNVSPHAVADSSSSDGADNAAVDVRQLPPLPSSPPLRRSTRIRSSTTDDSYVYYGTTKSSCPAAPAAVVDSVSLPSTLSQHDIPCDAVLGNHQRPGIDFDSTKLYAPVVSFVSIRILLALAVYLRRRIYNMDVTTAFLNAKVTEEIYIKLPRGMEEFSESGEPMVGRLLRALYGLRQSPGLWFTELDNYLKRNNFRQCTSDGCVYVQLVGTDGDFAAVAIYVDDIIILEAADPAWYPAFKTRLLAEFDCTDAGLCTWLMGMGLDWDDDDGVEHDMIAHSADSDAESDEMGVLDPVTIAQIVTEEEEAATDLSRRLCSILLLGTLDLQWGDPDDDFDPMDYFVVPEDGGGRRQGGRGTLRGPLEMERDDGGSEAG